MRLLTVATVSYLHQAEVMINSARLVHPELRPTIIVADCTSQGLPAVKEAFVSDVDLLCPDDLGFEFIERMREYYSVLEFCSALKVLGSAYVLRSEDSCLFLDPDMVILDTLSDTVLNQEGEVVISCHTFSPYPEDGAYPNNLEIFAAGMINGGVLLTRNGPEGNYALDWLVEKTRCHWFVSPNQGMYADQQWLSGLPFLFKEKTIIINDKGVNVAYWNLHERPLRCDPSSGVVSLESGEPLRLMHFSGFLIPSNGNLSAHNTRCFDEITEKILKRMISKYETSLQVAQLKYKHLCGDIIFTNRSLDDRLSLAAYYYNVDYSVAKKNKIQQLYYLFFKSKLINNGCDYLVRLLRIK